MKLDFKIGVDLSCRFGWGIEVWPALSLRTWKPIVGGYRRGFEASLRWLIWEARLTLWAFKT